MISIKKITIIALILILIGAAGSLLTFSSFEQATAVTEEQSFDKNITAIKVNTKNVGVNVLLSEEERVKVELTGNQLPNTIYQFSADLEDTTLSIKAEKNQQSWINIFPAALMLTVYLPEQQYEALDVDSNNGQVLAESLNIKNVRTKTMNGWTNLKSITATDVNVETNNGQITFDEVAGKVRGKTQNGQITFAAQSIERPIQLETGAGRILIQTKQKPTNVKFDVYTGSGIINILDSYTGSTVIGNGENLIKLSTKSGSITVE